MRICIRSAMREGWGFIFAFVKIFAVALSQATVAPPPFSRPKSPPPVKVGTGVREVFMKFSSDLTSRIHFSVKSPLGSFQSSQSDRSCQVPTPRRSHAHSCCGFPQRFILSLGTHIFVATHRCPWCYAAWPEFFRIHGIGSLSAHRCHHNGFSYELHISPTLPIR